MEDFFENDLKKAFPRMPVPKRLQNITLLREKAILEGKKAEELLKTNPQNQKSLMASAIIGRMSLITDFPEGSSIESLKQDLEKMPSFESFTKKPLNKQLEALKSREFLNIIAGKENTPVNNVPAVKEKTKEKGFVL